MIDYDENISLEPLKDEIIDELYNFCEKNVEIWTQPKAFFKRASIGDSQFNEKLSLIARTPNGKICAFFQGTTRGCILKGKRNKILKFFVVDSESRRNGLGTWMLEKLYERFKKLGLKGRISVFTSTPDYWFCGVPTFMTSAYHWLKKNNYRRIKLHIPFLDYKQDLFVDLNNNFSKKLLETKPLSETDKFEFIRMDEAHMDKALDFFSRNFSKTWKKEFMNTLKNEPPTSIIAIDKYTKNIVGFASYNAHFKGSFGPTGVQKSLRGHGIGGILLKWTLFDLKNTGHDRCEILWVGDKTSKYYSKVAGAYIGRILWPMWSKIR